MNLSAHFTLDELTHSDTAKREGIPNRPGEAQIGSLRTLCRAILEPLRAAVGGAIKVNSGYRGPQLNARIKGAAKSQHLTGEAADIQAPGVSVLHLFKTVVKLGLPFDQVIYEARSATSMWVHVSHAAGSNRDEIRVATFDAQGKPISYPQIKASEALAIHEPVSRSRGPAVLPTYEEIDDEPPYEGPRAKTAPARRAAAQKKPAARPAAGRKKAPSKKAPDKKAPMKKAPASKTARKRTAGGKAPAKKAAAKKAAR